MSNVQMEVIPSSDPAEGLASPFKWPASSLSAAFYVFAGSSLPEPASTPASPPAEPEPVPSPQDEAPLFATRTFRQRNAQQLKPFSLEAARYVANMNKRDWQDAVVVQRKTAELDSRELKAKKRAVLERGADDLDGWLELEDGMQVRREEQEAARMARPDEFVRQRKKQKLSEQEIRDRLLRQTLAAGRRSDSDSDGGEKRKKRKEDMRKSTAATSSRHDSAIDIDSSSSPPVASTSKHTTKRARSAEPSRRAVKANRAIELDTSSSPARQARSDSSEGTDEDGSDDEAIERRRRRPPRAASVDSPPEKFELKGKRKKQLQGMMPKVFLKRAKADLQLMAKEKAEGHEAPELHTRGSGDEAAESEEEAEAELDASRAAVVRKRPVDEDEPFRLQGDTESEGDARAVEDASSEEDAHNAVSNWLHANAPRRKHHVQRPQHHAKSTAPSGRDIIDRLLHQSRKQATKRTGPKKAFRKRRPLQERRRNVPNAMDIDDDLDLLDELKQLRPEPSRKGHATSSTRRHPAQVRSLADDDTLFTQYDFGNEPLGGANRYRAPAGNVHEIPPVHLDAFPVTKPGKAKRDAEWASFSKFSYDFGIQPLPSRLQCRPLSYIGAGHLFRFLQFVEDPLTFSQAACTVFPFGIQLDFDMALDALVDVLPRLCDNIIDQAAAALSSATDEKLFADDAVEVIRFLGAFFSRPCDLEDSNVLSTVQSQLDHMERRLNGLEGVPERRAAFQIYLLPLQWALLELSIRMHFVAATAGIDASTLPAIEFLFRKLVNALLDYGINRSGKALKALQNPGQTLIEDGSLLVWACLLNTSLSTKGSAISVDVLDEQAFWILVEGELAKKQASDGVHPVVAAEAAAYLAMLCCALSQVSGTGQVLLKPRLAAHWATVAHALDPISVTELGRESSHLSNSELTRRDGYIWTLMARCLIFVHRWHWTIGTNEALLPKLNELLRARSLKNSTVDGSRDFPSFLIHYSGAVDTQLKAKEDSTFHLFLKLLLCMAQAQNHLPSEERARVLSTALMRIAPLATKVPYTRDNPVLDSDRSMLINRYSMFATFVIVSPQVMSKRLGQIRSVLSYEQADDLARSVILRAMMYLALVFRHHELPLDGLVGWFASICTYLREQYVELEKKRALQAIPTAIVQRGMSAITHSAEKEKASKELATSLFRIAIALTMILRAWQNIMVADGSGASYPDKAWLDHAWIRDILVSPIAHDPLVGLECLTCIQCFFDLRSKALARLKPVQVSQDEFGFDEVDFNDPALNQLIGYEAQPAATAVLKDKDAEFGQFVKLHLSPALWKLLSAIYAPELDGKRSAPTINQASDIRPQYVLRVVQCWTACASIMVDCGLRDWDSYLVFGEETFKRISDPLGRREVGMLFGSCLFNLNEAAFAAHYDEFVGIWFESVVARRLTQQHTFTNQLLNALSADDALFTSITVGKQPDSDLFSFTPDSFVKSRAGLFDALCRNINALLNGLRPLKERVPSKAQLFQWINAMLGALRDNVESFSAQEATEKAEYVVFVRAVMRSLKETAGSQINDRSTPNWRLLAGYAPS